MRISKKKLFCSAIALGTIVFGTIFSFLLTSNNSKLTDIKTNIVHKLKAKSTGFIVPELINSSLHDSIPQFNVNNLRVSESLKAKKNNSVTKEDAYNIIVRNQVPLFGSSLGNDKLSDKLDQASLTIQNNYSYNLITFTLNGIVINEYGTIGNKQYQLCLYGFQPEVNYMYIGLIVAVPTIIILLIVSAILITIFKKRKKYKFKSQYVVIDNELIDTTKN